MINLDELIKAANHVEALPTTAGRVLSIIARDDFGLSEVEQAVALDAAVTARLLRAANSASTHGLNPVATAGQAVQRLGTGMVLSLVIGNAVQGRMQKAVPEYGLGEGALWSHSMRAALAAQSLKELAPSVVPLEAYTAALLHDFGKLVLAGFLGPRELALLGRAEKEAGLSRLDAERELLQVHHGELGGIIAQQWNLPERIVRAVSYHHTPEEIGDACAYVVRVADLLAHASETELPSPEHAREAESSMDELGIAPAKFEALRRRTRERYSDAMAKA